MILLSNEHLWGMSLIWWFIWGAFLFWIFAMPYNIPGQRLKKDTPLDIIKKRFAKGEINLEEFQEKKELLKK